MAKKSKTNYSWKTSLPAYLENAIGKALQTKLVLYVLKKFKGKRGTLKEVQDYLRTHYRILLPQSTISGRFGDLRDEKKIAFYGETTIYRGRLRKVFEVVNKHKKKKVVKKSKRPKQYRKSKRRK